METVIPVRLRRKKITGMTCGLLLLGVVSCAADENIRYPFVSGEFYPSSPKELSQTIDGFFSKVPNQPKVQGQIKILILPHAGYVYSGQTAAYGYKLIEGSAYDTVILIGPYHKASFPGASIWKSGSWRTSLGDVPVDAEMANAIARESPDFNFSENAHLTEHSLEVQLPFLQNVLTNFKIVPILINDSSPKMRRALARAIYKNIQNKKALIIISSDMSHYYPDSTARKMDLGVLDILKEQDTERLSKSLDSRESEFCGGAAVLTALEISKLLGNTKLEVLHYANSAETTGDFFRVVGYSASMIYQMDENYLLNEAQKKELLKLARNTVETYVNQGRIYQAEIHDPVFMEKRAVFVTIRKKSQLRGCIGSLVAEAPLYSAVQDMAVQAATHDPRFSPINKEELNELSYEVSLLSPPTRVKDVEGIVMGKHGVILEQGGHFGVFLPKVGEELGYNKKAFLDELCTQKANLLPDCWQDPRTTIYTFTAQEITENK